MTNKQIEKNFASMKKVTPGMEYTKTKEEYIVTIFKLYSFGRVEIQRHIDIGTIKQAWNPIQYIVNETQFAINQLNATCRNFEGRTA